MPCEPSRRRRPSAESSGHASRRRPASRPRPRRTADGAASSPLGPFRLRDRFPARELSIKFVQFLGPHGEHGATLQHLQLDAHLEHVGGRSHRHVGLTRFGEHLANGVRTARLDARLIDRPGADVRRTHAERRRDRSPGSRCRPPSPTPDAIGVPNCRQSVPQRQDRWQQRDGGPIVGVATRVSLGGQVVAHRHRGSPVRLAAGVMCSAATQVPHDILGAGDRNLVATSVREILAMIRCGSSLPFGPASSRRRDSEQSPASGRDNADASTCFTPG